MRYLYSAALVFFLAGCHIYVPVGPAIPEPGAQVRARISDTAASGLSPQLGPGVVSLDGSILQVDDSEIVLALQSVRTVDRGTFPWTREHVKLDRNQIVTLERRKLSVGRTALFIGSMAAGWYLLRREAGAGHFEPKDKTPPQNPI